jgi:hypothetical protein
LIRVDFDDAVPGLTFFKEAENMPPHVMARMVDKSVMPPHDPMASEAVVELPRVAGARSIKR